MSVARKVVIPNAETWADTISPEHVAYLTERAVAPHIAAAAGLRTVTAEEGGQLLGFAWPLSSFGLLVPYPNVDGYARIRVDHDGKWLAPEAREVPIYITPGCQREGDAPLFVVEGPVKALAMANHGFNAVALGGVATTLTSERKLNDSWKDLALFHRDVTVIFDANRQQNVAVARAEARLVRALEAAGARVRVVALPLRDGGEDQGPDDFLATHAHEAQPLRACVADALPGDPVERAKGVIDKEGALNLLADLPFLMAVHERGPVAQENVADVLGKHKVTRTLLRQAVKAALEGGKRAKVNAPPVAEYRAQDGRFCLVTSSGSNERVDPVCNFSANIVEDRTLDDGSGETSRVFVIEGALADGRVLERVSVSPEELIGDLWPTKKWGSAVIVSAAIPRAAHHLMNAIKALSNSVTTTAFGHTGFREHKGAFIFLHAGGAVGDDNVVVDLTGGAAKVLLPDAVVDPVRAVKTSLSALRVGVESITRPLHASVYRAPLNELLLSDLVVDVYGKTGSLKSSTTAVFQSHFGDFDHASLPVSWEWTANAIETGLHRMKDVLVVIDDLVPKADPRDEIHKKVERTVRSIANGAARGRLSSDLRSRPERPCRATVIITSEDVPRGESIQARLVALQVRQGDVNQAELTRVQAEQHRLPHAMRAYIEWLQPQMLRLKTEVKRKFLEFRDQLHVVGHLRAPSAIAHLLLGAFYFSEFAKAIGVMSDAEAEEHVTLTREALLVNAGAQALATEQSNPALRFVEVLRNLYVGRRIALRSKGYPLGSNEIGAVEIGWKDLSYAYVLADTALAIVNRELVALNEAQPLRSYGLWKRMVEDGYIEPAGEEPTHKFDSEGTRVRVLKMPLSVLRGDPGGHDPDGDAEDEDDPDYPAPDDNDEAEPPAHLRLDRLLRSRAANDGFVRMSGSCPEVLKLPDSKVNGSEVAETIEQAASSTTLDPLSVRMSGCSKGRVAHELGVFAEGGLANETPLVRELSPADIRTSGHPDTDAFTEALLKAGRVGVAVAGDPIALLAIAVPNGPSRVLDLGGKQPGPILDALARATLVGHDLRPVVALFQDHSIGFIALYDTAVAWKLYDGHRHEEDDYFSLSNARKVIFGTEAAVPAGVRDRLELEARDALAFEHELQILLKEDGLQAVAELEFALLPVLVEIQTTGVTVDRAKWETLTATWAQEAAGLRKILTRALGVKNVDDHVQVLAALQRLGLPVDRTNSEALAPYLGMQVIEQLLLYRRRSSFVASTGEAVLDALKRSPDGRVRTTFRQLGARTGRMSCSEPNLMGLPRDECVRACIVAPPGKKLVVGDYKAIEMRVIADQTGDEQLRQVFATPGRCPHRHTATVLLTGRSEEFVTDDEKNEAKPVNFGLCFGMSSKTLVPYARKNFKVVMSELQAEQFKEKFLRHYEGVRKWQEDTGSEMASSLRTRSGRVTYYLSSDEDYNARLSFPIQGTAADGMKAAMVLLQPKLKPIGARIVLVVHDELLVEAPEEHAEVVRVLMQECMIEGMQKYVATVPIEVDLRIASSWAKTEKGS